MGLSLALTPTEPTPSDRLRRMALAHGVYNVLSGAWPLLHMRSFEAAMGPKEDTWLVRTVAGLLVSNGAVQLQCARHPEHLAAARLIGIGTAATLAAIDLVYVPRGRIRVTYAVDAAAEIAWIVAWLRTPALPSAD